MPAIRDRNARRSRRLCRLSPRFGKFGVTCVCCLSSDVASGDAEWEDHRLFYTASESPSLQPFFTTASDATQTFASAIAFDEAHSPLSNPAIDHTGDFTTPEPASPQLPSSDDKERIKRPPNAFFCYRTYLWSTIKGFENVERDHRNISKIAGQRWKLLTPAQKLPFKQQAEELKRLHALRYPDYKYAPGARKGKASKRRSSRVSGRDTKRCKRESESPMPVLESPTVASASTHPVQEVPVHAVPSLDEVASRPQKSRSHQSSRKSRKPSSKPSPTPSPPLPDVASQDHVPEFTFPPAQTEEEATEATAQCGGFVLTSDIPPLDLNCSKPEEEVSVLSLIYSAFSHMPHQIPYASDVERDMFGYPGATVVTGPSVMSRYNASHLNYSYDPSSSSYDSTTSYDSSPSLASSSSSHLDSPRFMNPWFPGEFEDDEAIKAAKRYMYENEYIAPHEPWVHSGDDTIFDMWNESPLAFSF